MKKTIIAYFLVAYSTLIFSQVSLHPFLENGLYGYLKSTIEDGIPAKYTFAGDFSDSLALVATEGNYLSSQKGYINEKGDWVIEPKYVFAGDFSEGLARVQINEKWGYINKKDELVINPTYQLCYEFSNGYAKVQVKNKWGLIDKTGKFVVEPQYYDITDFSGEAYGYQEILGKPWGLRELNGSERNMDTVKKMYNFREGLAPARNTKDLWGFINDSGEWVIEPTYTNAHIFSSGLASVEVNYSKWGFINKEGEIVISPKYDRHGIFRGSWARVEIGNTVYYINKQGEEVYYFDK